MFLLLLVAVIGNLLACAILITRSPRISMACVVVVSLMIIPHQLALGIQYMMITHEVKQVIEYADQSILNDGKPPADLSAYRFRFPSISHHIRYTLNKKNGGYGLSWYIGNRNASHWYSPHEGWRYYPD